MNKKAFNIVLSIYKITGFILLTLSLVLILIPIFPYVWYRVNPNATVEDESKISIDVVEESIDGKDKGKTLPEKDISLPDGYYIDIPSVGIYSKISVTSKYSDALKVGSWIVPEYGTPEKDALPIIIASHRFGYSNWSREERNKISFYKLPSTKLNDEVYIYWNQRKYIYKIYSLEESTYISDYDADLILYTCKYFNSPVRIFRYAQRVN